MSLAQSFAQPQPKVGYHVSKSKGLFKNISQLVADGGRAAQFFLSPNKGFQPGICLTDGEVKQILNLRDELGVYLVVHGKYILNFARPHSDKTAWQQQALIVDMREAHRLGANVIIHQGKNVKDLNYSRQQAIDAFVTNIKSVLDETEKHGIMNKIILENSCQQGNELGYTIEELADIYSKFEPKYQERLGFCLDLCHIHVSGTLDVSKPAEVDRIICLFDSLIGIKKLEVIHFNDSKIRFDGHNDNHEDILVGYIGNAGIGSADGFKRILRLAQQYNIPMILETPSVDPQTPQGIPYKDQIELLLSWAEGATNPGYQAIYESKHHSQILAFADKANTAKAPKTKSKTISIGTNLVQSVVNVEKPTPMTAKPVIKIIKKKVQSELDAIKPKPKIIIKKL